MLAQLCHAHIFHLRWMQEKEVPDVAEFDTGLERLDLHCLTLGRRLPRLPILVPRLYPHQFRLFQRGKIQQVLYRAEHRSSVQLWLAAFANL